MLLVACWHYVLKCPHGGKFVRKISWQSLLVYVLYILNHLSAFLEKSEPFFPLRGEIESVRVFCLGAATRPVDVGFSQVLELDEIHVSGRFEGAGLCLSLDCHGGVLCELKPNCSINSGY
jgi:hypothetical protein